MTFNILLISFGFAFTIIALGFVLFSKNSTTKNFYLSNNNNLPKEMQAIVATLGGDILALLPEEVVERQRRNKKLDSLFMRSGNPWGLTRVEFMLTRIVMTTIGFVASMIFVISLGLPLIAQMAIVALSTFLGFQFIVIHYASEAKSREAKFRAELPEGIDYLVMALSGQGASLPLAFERAVYYMEDGVIRDEFINIINALNARKSMSQALREFGEKAPTDGIHAFVKALSHAEKQDTPKKELLRNRSEASREELYALIDLKIAALPTNVMLVITPVALITVLLISLSPMAMMLFT